MNRPQVRALAADAFHQVLDNGVFRILVVLCALPVLFTFLVGFREEGVVLFFGFKTWSYAEMFGAFGQHVLPADPRGLAIEGVLQLVLEFLAGSLGMLVVLSATSFFVPRLLEKGAAELYFHKPVSRAVLFLSRYFAGLLFVALSSFVLVGGMALGLALVSGHVDPGILVAPLTLTYTFAPIYAVTQLAGVITRSTVASLLVSSFFFLFNGCIQQGWIQWQQAEHGPSLRPHRARADESETTDRALEADPPEGEPAGTPEDSGSSAREVLLDTLDALHFVLPKTTDADYLGHKLRAALAHPLYRDEDSLVTVASLPEGLTPLDAPELAAEIESEPELRARLGVPVLGARGDAARHSLWRREAERTETRIGERVRERVETASQAAKTLEEALAGRAGVRELARDGERFGSGFGGGEIAGTRVSWREGAGDASRTRAALVFKGTRDETVFTLLCDCPGELSPEDAAAARRVLASRLDIDEAAAKSWYPSQLALDAPLRFNILFSIGSTLAFAAAMLALGTWRLARIAF